MKDFGKIVGFNLLAILIYSVVIRVTSDGQSLSIMLISAVAVGIHFLAALAVAGATAGSGEKETARAWLLTAIVVLLVGFSACLGNASI